MTSDPATHNGGGTYASAYEDLRHGVLAGSPFGSPLGLVVLLRQGLAAWMARPPAGARLEPMVDPRPCRAGTVVSDELQVAVVRVLASMVVSGRRELSA